jgi:3-dehydroquinate synthase
MREIRVELGERSYSIFVGAGILAEADRLFGPLAQTPVLIVTDEGVARAQEANLNRLLESLNRRVVRVAPGEESKSMAGFSSLIDRLVEFEQDTVALLAFGGGVVGDLTGFAAACYKRGVPWIQVPTTLLAQVDASVGGKCAINHPRAKNLVGAFHQPRMVIADVETLHTLPARELRSGLAEVIKHGVIADAAFFDRVEQTIGRALQLDLEVLEDYVTTSCRIKAAVVGEDERDITGQRAALNYGHTLGHAIELAAHFRYTHGEAIAIGMACAGDLSVRLGLLNPVDAGRIEAVLQSAGLPTRAADLEANEVLAAMNLDKKFLQGANRFVIAREIGAVELRSAIPRTLIEEVLADRLAG